MSNLDENFCKSIEQAISTLHSLTGVLQNLDSNLKRLVQPETSASDPTQEQLDLEFQSTSVYLAKEQEEDNLNGSQNKDEIDNVLSATGSESDLRRQSQFNSRSSLQQQSSSGTADGSQSRRQSELRSRSQTQLRSSLQQESSTGSLIESPDQSQIQSPLQQESSTEVQSRRQSQMPVRSSMRQKSSISPENEPRPSKIRPSMKANSKTSTDQGRMTTFIEKFESYVEEMAGKIDSLNDRVVALGYMSQEEDSQK